MPPPALVPVPSVPPPVRALVDTLQAAVAPATLCAAGGVALVGLLVSIDFVQTCEQAAAVGRLGPGTRAIAVLRGVLMVVPAMVGAALLLRFRGSASRIRADASPTAVVAAIERLGDYWHWTAIVGIAVAIMTVPVGVAALLAIAGH